MAADFNHAFDLLMELEVGSLPNGGYIADDNGAGPCKWGWTERKLRSIGWRGRVSDLAHAEAKTLTYTHFWLRYHLDQVDSTRFATILLCQLYNQEAMVYAWQASLGVTVDGNVGPATIAATNNRENKWMVGGLARVITLFLELALMRYLDLVIKNPTRYEKFLNGWKARLEVLKVRA